MFYMLSFFNLPSASTITTDAGAYSAPFFTEFIGLLIGIAVGIPIAILAIKWLIKLVRGNVSKLFRGRRGGRRRR